MYLKLDIGMEEIFIYCVTVIIQNEYYIYMIYV